MGYGQELLKAEVAPSRIRFLYRDQIVKPTLWIFFPPVECVFGNIQVEWVPNAGNDRLVLIPGWYIIAKTVLLSFIVEIPIQGQPDPMTGFEAMDLSSKRAWA
jgi:hypothetical protein